MKKFGTPIGAGPGSESEKVGLVAEGTPLPVGSSLDAGEVVFGSGVDLDCRFGCWLELGLIGLGPPLCVDVGWFSAEPDGWGGVGVRLVEVVLVDEGELALLLEDVLVVGVVELEVLEVGVEPVVEEAVVDEPVVDEPVVDEPVVEEPVVEELVVEELVVEELVVDELLVAAGAQLIVSETITPLIGRDRDVTGVPGGTSTGKVNCWPPRRVTSTVHGSAEAFGTAASPRVRTADVTATTSFRLPSTVACLLPTYLRVFCGRMERAPRPHGGVGLTLLTASELCNGEALNGHKPFTGLVTSSSPVWSQAFAGRGPLTILLR
jgi:hypothetical protein